MPAWTNTPPSPAAPRSLTLLRCPAGKTLSLISTSSDLIGCATHYWAGRTQPCEAEHCEPCTKGMPARWHGYLACLDPATRETYIFECTSAAAEKFLEYRNAYGTMRGMHFNARRAKNSANSRLLLQCTPADQARIRLPDEPDVAAILMMIWRLPQAAIAITPDATGSADLHLVQTTIDRMRGKLQKENGTRENLRRKSD